MLSKFRLEKALGLMVLLTLVAIVGEQKILKTSMVINSGSGYNVHLYNDVTSMGNSEIELIDPVNFEWRCVLKDQYIFPFCGFEILIDPARKNGLDFSGFNKIKIWMDYEGSSETVRVYLRNFDARYSKEGDDPSTKYNQIEFKASLLDQPVEFSLDDFFVANWWLLEYKIPPQLGHPQFDNIVIFEVQTGSVKSLGDHHFKLRQVELTGRRLSTEEWYLAIMMSWLVVILVFLGYRIFLLTDEVRQQKRREVELLEINALLDMRSRELEEKSRTDTLTGAFNREGIEEAIKMGLWEWRSHHKPLSIVMLDIDLFKDINDTYGHAVGDKVLSELSSLVQKCIRSDDLFARWGGEEFVLVCRSTRIGQAAVIAGKLRELIANHDFGEGLHLTVSMGVATLNANEPLEHLFKSADDALYSAKHDGRNRVVVAEQSY